ncbi:MAG: hypothetical protein HYT62_02150 [Candidatus Yanofskybacteria bacterium]|nr:hypothetical protein [Candidatus Yanofskybacteria bacterium]
MLSVSLILAPACQFGGQADTGNSSEHHLTIPLKGSIIVLILVSGENDMQVVADASKHTLKLTAENDMDEDELIRLNYVVVGSKKWYQFWKKSPAVKLTMAGDKKERLKIVEISF